MTTRAILALPGLFVTRKVNSELKALNAKKVAGFEPPLGPFYDHSWSVVN